MTAIWGFGILVLLTVVHEAGHWAAVRLGGGRVRRLTVGWGTSMLRRPGEPELRIGLLPVGGRIDYDGIAEGTGQGIVALGGALANLLLAAAFFLAGSLLFGVEGFAPAGEAAGGIRFALASTLSWFWLVPGALVDLVVAHQVGGLRRGFRLLWELLSWGGAPGILYVTAAGSALWASLNLIPIPWIGTDGWHVLRSVFIAVRPRGRES